VTVDCDANATYAPDESLQGVIVRAISLSGNPSSLHRGGQRAKAALEEARAAVREFLGAEAHDQVVFTSGASEANNTVIASCSAERPVGRIISTLIEHPCVLEPLKALQSAGRDVVFVAPDASGEVPVDGVVRALTPDTALVSVMAANNETGVLNRVGEIARAVREIAPRARIHTDAAQLPGKVPVSFWELGADYMTVSGHKVGAPAGVGALVIRDGVSLKPLILGGPQEGKLRGGTENVLGIVSFGAVASVVGKDLAKRIGAMRGARDAFEALMAERCPTWAFNGRDRSRLPNTSSVFIPGVRADDLVVALDLEGILISAGAACSSGKPEPSHVLLAMDQDAQRVKSTVRISFRADIEPKDVERLVDVLCTVAGRMNRSA
jgi:cysteine desulfurase